MSDPQTGVPRIYDLDKALAQMKRRDADDLTQEGLDAINAILSGWMDGTGPSEMHLR